MGHYSAVCDQPDVVKKIEEQIKEAAAEPKQTKEKIDAIRNKLGLDAFPGPTIDAGVNPAHCRSLEVGSSTIRRCGCRKGKFAAFMRRSDKGLKQRMYLEPIPPSKCASHKAHKAGVPPSAVFAPHSSKAGFPSLVEDGINKNRLKRQQQKLSEPQ
ncbi:hypothetical protein Aduo_005729 [Ancylostoma duodenale]